MKTIRLLPAHKKRRLRDAQAAYKNLCLGNMFKNNSYINHSEIPVFMLGDCCSVRLEEKSPGIAKILEIIEMEDRKICKIQ